MKRSSRLKTLTSRQCDTPREAVVCEYARWLKRKPRIDRIAEDILRNSAWDARDKALFLELLYGVIRWHGTLDYLVRSLSNKDAKINPHLYAAVAVGLYQLLFLSRIPDHAAVDTAVDLVKRSSGAKAAGWVNAILRRAVREKDGLLRDLPPDIGKIERTAILHSHPVWMIARWSRRLPENKLNRFLEWNNRRPAVSLRVNTRRCEPQNIIDSLAATGLTANIHPIDPDFLLLQQPGDPGLLDVVKNGSTTVQDVSQGLIGKLLDPQPGEVILDLCAAPGGKTSHLSELCPECRIVATDKSEERLSLVRDSVARCGLNNVEVHSYDMVMRSNRKYNAVLIDAPCTGTGVLARRPDLRWRRQLEDTAKMAAVQLELLRYSAERLTSNGRIIYSTCSVEEEENEDVVRKFLEMESGFRVIAPCKFLPAEAVDEAGYLMVWGPEIQGDGIFAVRLERTSDK